MNQSLHNLFEIQSSNKSRKNNSQSQSSMNDKDELISFETLINKEFTRIKTSYLKRKLSKQITLDGQIKN